MKNTKMMMMMMMMMINRLFQMEKESEEGMATDQETIRLLFYIVRLRDMVGILYMYKHDDDDGESSFLMIRG